MKQLERDKVELQGQLRDLEWRLDNESKVNFCHNYRIVGWIKLSKHVAQTYRTPTELLTPGLFTQVISPFLCLVSFV